MFLRVVCLFSRDAKVRESVVGWEIRGEGWFNWKEAWWYWLGATLGVAGR